MEHTSEEPAEAELLVRYFEGDPAAFDELIAQWRGRLARYFLTFGLRYEDVEDLVQETILRLFLLRDNTAFDRDRPLDGYVLRTARNLALNARRRDREVTVTVEEWHAVLQPSVAPEDTELAAELSRCLVELPPELRAVLLECGKHGLGETSHDEIAAAQKKWPSQVSTLCRRARILLRGCLSRRGFR